MVCKNKSRSKPSEFAHEDNCGWKVLVRDAEEKVKEAKRRVEELELSLETFKRYEREGVPWPLEESATRN